MCLTLKENKNSNIATEDITVFKRLKTSTKLPEIYQGKKFTGVINGQTCFGKIFILDENYFCTDNPALDGQIVFDKLGFKYSWVMDSFIEEIVVKGVCIIKNSVLCINQKETVLTTPYYNSIIEIGQTYISEIVKDNENVEKALHSFATLEAAKADGNGIFAKCIIPKGSVYYEGTFWSLKSYASDTLTYLEII